MSVYVKLNASYQVVSLSDFFLTLRSVKGSRLSFVAKYQYDQEVGIKNNITKVNVKVTRTISPAVNAASNAASPSVSLARRIVVNSTAHVELLKQHQANDLVVSVDSDPTAHVSNEAVPLLRRGYAATQLPQLRKRLPAVVTVDDPSNAVTVSAIHAQHDVGEHFNTDRQLAEDLLALGLDPSSAYDLNDIGVTLAEGLDGTFEKSPSQFANNAEKLRYRYKSLPYLKPLVGGQKLGDAGTVDPEPTDGQTTTTMKNVTRRNVDVVADLEFDYGTNDPDRLYVTFTASNVNGVTVQTLTRTFYPGEYVKYHTIPTLPPHVKAAQRVDKNHTLLSIRQRDPTAKYVRVYSRLYNHHTLTFEPYERVAEFDLDVVHGQKLLPVETSIGNTILYRVVALSGNKTLGSGFESHVAKPTLKTSLRHFALVATPLLNGVKLETTALPSDCVSFQLIRKDITTHVGSAVVNVGTPTFVDSADSGKVYETTDDTVIEDEAYYYGCRIYRKNGSSFEKFSIVYEHRKLVENLVRTELNDVRAILDDSGYDVKFAIASDVVDTDVDRLKQLLQQQGLYDLYAADVQTIREQLNKLLAHNVRRVDMTTGEVEDFGTVTSLNFSDKDSRDAAGVSELRTDRKYRYVVTALLRSPETMLDFIVKQAKDASSGRTYEYRPFKFFHPLVSQTGAIVTQASTSRNHSQDAMGFGNVGNYAAAEVSLNNQKPLVIAATRESFGEDVDVLKWTIRGLAKDVDHFQIVLSHGGKKSVVAKQMCTAESQSFTLVRKLKKYEAGLNLQYIVIPVYHDFTRGAEVLVANVKGT